mgnify:CR=1 FL=1
MPADFTPKIRLTLCRDHGEWAAEAEDIDSDGRYDGAACSIVNPDSRLLAALDPDDSHEALGVPVDGGVRIEDVGGVV